MRATVLPPRRAEAWITPFRPLAVGRQGCYISSREAVSRVRSHISPGPYRSFRELSLAGSVDPVIWCPPTFVGNSGIECSNGHRGFALFFLLSTDSLLHYPSSTLAAAVSRDRGFDRRRDAGRNAKRVLALDVAHIDVFSV